MALGTMSILEPLVSQPTSGKGLDGFFSPKNVAVVGATDKVGSVGRTVLLNLSHGPFAKKLYAVNPKRTEVLGVPSFPSVTRLPEPVDLVIVVTPATTVPEVVGECVDAGSKAVVVISAGFRERGAEGTELENKIRAHLNRGETRLIGPTAWEL